MTCLIDSCGGRPYGRGWCRVHYMRWYKFGDPLHPYATPENRFWPNVDKDGPGGCWLWTGLRNSLGYGRFGIGYKSLGAHRFAYELLVGPIPDGLVLDHLCRNPPCVNPAHLEPVTNTENILRGVSPFARRKRQTACVNGHPFDAENTYYKSNGCRACKVCTADRSGGASRRRRQMLAYIGLPANTPKPVWEPQLDAFLAGVAGAGVGQPGEHTP